VHSPHRWRRLQELLASDELTDEAVLRISQDYLREVVAHEVGHVLACAIILPAAWAASHQPGIEDWFKAYLLGQPLDAIHQ